MVVEVPVVEASQPPSIVEQAAPTEMVLEEHIPMQTGVPDGPRVLLPVIGETMSDSR